FWKRTTRSGALAGIVAGGTMVFFWKLVVRPAGGVFGIYELLPAFLFSCGAIAVVSWLSRAPAASITTLFDEVNHA
ncbi:MAG TPA: sodium:proline symporter, partial [bacterium]|nr:sodium:proline symporter [bacterium]